MGIWLIVTIWMLLAGVFVLAICSAAARSIPKSVGANVEEHNSFNCETELETPRANKLHPVFWLAILLAIVTTSCTVTNASRPVSTGSSEPVKGATLLMDHSR
jgi:hypothetical protein